MERIIKQSLYAACTVICLVSPRDALAWVFPEHTRITQTATRGLYDSGASALIRGVVGLMVDDLHLCDKGDRAENCLTLDHLPSLAGDHSCTPWELRTSLQSLHAGKETWITGVLEVAADTGHRLDAAGSDANARADIRRQMHVDLQGKDARYVERALLDWSHFQLARESGRFDDLTTYLRFAFAPARESNATAAYANYHVAAVRLANQARTATNGKTDLLVRAVLAESFALHFLEDSFSTGHFVGHWGDDATRLGTHDFYSHVGLEAVRWMSPTSPFVAHGDAFLTDEETAVAAAAVRASLAQVLDAATDEAKASQLLASYHDVFGFEQYNSCDDPHVAPALVALAESAPIKDVLRHEPVPSPRFPAVPRVRAEKGVFFGGAATVEGGYTLAEQAANSRVRATFRAGYGAAGIVDDPINAQAFGDIGFVGEYIAPSAQNTYTHGSVTGFTFRARAPGYIALVDGAVAILLAESLKARCPFCIAWAAAAAGGGMGRVWRTRPLGGAFAWQISALREGTFNYFSNEPSSGRYRTEILAPALTARSALPMAGDGLSQATDVYIDIGPSLAWTSQHPYAFVGIFASLSAAIRLFP